MSRDLLGDWPTALKDGMKWAGTAAAVAALVCTAFSALSSFGLIFLFSTRPEDDVPVSMGRLLVKALFFLVISLVLGAWVLQKGRRHDYQTASELAWSPQGASNALWMVLPLLLVIGFIFPRLDAHPWMAPDEAHHFVVARNLAEHGLYASGHPDGGDLRVFDTYDSVGAPVIAPVAGALRAFGSGLVSGRAAIGVFYLLLCMGLFVFLKPVYGSLAAAVSIVFVTFGFGSVYLARTLYGEVPAMTFVVFGLLFWRKSILGCHSVGWAMLCGISFGLAVLSKSIVALAVFPLAGAYLYDLLTFRRIRWHHVFVPGVAGAFVIVFWWTIQSVYRHDVAGAAEGTLSVYQHNLMFGLGSAPRAVWRILQEPAYAVGLLLATICIAPSVFLVRYDPASVALYLIAAFYGYWWVFFTPGQIPRYLWMSYAIAGAFAGILVTDLARQVYRVKTPIAARATCAMLLLILVAPLVTRAMEEGGRVLFSDEMRDDRAIAEFVQNLPPNTRVVTTYWPLQNTLNFLTGRFVGTLESIPDLLPPDTVLFADTRTQMELVAERTPSSRIGPYVIFYRKE